jgi:hypothetical protein
MFTKSGKNSVKKESLEEGSKARLQTSVLKSCAYICHENYMDGGTAPFILNLDTRLRRVVSLMA